MSNQNAYIRYFGSSKELGIQNPWTEGVYNIYEHVAWDTRSVLGVSKTTIWKNILEWNDEPAVRSLSLEARKAHIDKRLKDAMKASEAKTPYEMPTRTIATPYDGLRRQRFFPSNI